MEYKKFKDLEIPAIGFGTYKINNPDIIKKALKFGYRHIDTARMYGNESDVGEAWKSSGISREEIFITTKIWHTRLKPDQVKKDVDDSLKKLNTDFVDLLLIHWPSTEDVPLEETLGAFEEVKNDGKARAIGISNFTAEMQQKAMDITETHCNQVEYHPFLGQNDLLELCRKSNVALTAYRPIANNEVSENDTIKQIAMKYKKNPAQITLRWQIQQDPVIAIPRSSNNEHIQGNIEVFDFELTDEEMDEIFSLDKGLRQIQPVSG